MRSSTFVILFFLSLTQSAFSQSLEDTMTWLRFHGGQVWEGCEMTNGRCSLAAGWKFQLVFLPLDACKLEVTVYKKWDQDTAVRDTFHIPLGAVLALREKPFPAPNTRTSQTFSEVALHARNPFSCERRDCFPATNCAVNPSVRECTEARLVMSTNTRTQKIKALAHAIRLCGGQTDEETPAEKTERERERTKDLFR